MRVVTAKAFGGPEVLVVEDVPEPEAGQGQVVVEVSIAPALYLDTQIRAGKARAWFPVTPPYVPGAGVAGRVTAVGAGAGAGWASRRVVADTPHGGYLERALVPAGGLITVPDGLGLAEAGALLHDGRTALGLVEALSPRANEWALVLGAAGGLGSLLVQLAHQAGSRVIAAARGKRKLDLARRLGAEAAVDYTEPEWTAEVLTITGRRGPQAVFDGVGGGIGRAAFEVTARGGRFSAHGTPGGGFARVDPADAALRQIALSGIERVQFAPEDGKRLAEQALRQAAAGRIKPVIGQTFPLERAADAHRAIESRAVTGKTLLEV
jgi:NADPH:quinone reductase